MTGITEAQAVVGSGTKKVEVHGIEVPYIDGIGPYGAISPEGSFETIGSSMGNHLALIRQHTDTPIEMAKILSGRMERYEAGLGDLGLGEQGKVRNTIAVYGHFVSKVGGNGSPGL